MRQIVSVVKLLCFARNRWKFIKTICKDSSSWDVIVKKKFQKCQKNYSNFRNSFSIFSFQYFEILGKKVDIFDKTRGYLRQNKSKKQTIMSKYQMIESIGTTKHFENIGQIRKFFWLNKMFFRQIVSKVQKNKT